MGFKFLAYGQMVWKEGLWVSTCTSLLNLFPLDGDILFLLIGCLQRRVLVSMFQGMSLENTSTVFPVDCWMVQMGVGSTASPSFERSTYLYSLRSFEMQNTLQSKAVLARSPCQNKNFLWKNGASLGASSLFSRSLSNQLIYIAGSCLTASLSSKKLLQGHLRVACCKRPSLLTSLVPSETRDFIR